VDKFVFTESTHTYSGVYKGLVYEANKERFAKWHDKIIYSVIDDYPADDEFFGQALDSPLTGDKSEYWLREFYEEECMKRPLKNCNDDDLIFISDIDEIWNPKILPLIDGEKICKPKQLPYINYLNQRSDEDWLGWTGTIATKYKNIKNGIINHLRTDDMTEFKVIENGGWHFGTLGGLELKKQSWANPKYDTFHPIVVDRRETNIRIDELDLPEYLVYNREKYGKYFK
jgi:beta-1,4-mannosyl-glycoprotein beta-1,4-N-acetylglucosaminyltransferase